MAEQDIALSKHFQTIQDLQQLVHEKEKRLTEVRSKLAQTNDEREAIRARMLEMSKQVEEIAAEIKRIQCETGRGGAIDKSSTVQEQTLKEALDVDKPSELIDSEISAESNDIFVDSVEDVHEIETNK